MHQDRMRLNAGAGPISPPTAGLRASLRGTGPPAPATPISETGQPRRDRPRTHTDRPDQLDPAANVVGVNESVIGTAPESTMELGRPNPAAVDTGPGRGPV